MRSPGLSVSPTGMRPHGRGSLVQQDWTRTLNHSSNRPGPNCHKNPEPHSHGGCFLQGHFWASALPWRYITLVWSIRSSCTRIRSTSRKSTLGLYRWVDIHKERVLFIGTRFSNLYTSVDTPARTQRHRHRHRKPPPHLKHIILKHIVQNTNT
jgi:hypothetical protein